MMLKFEKYENVIAYTKRFSTVEAPNGTLKIHYHINELLTSNLTKSQKILDRDHYGLKKVKERVLEVLAVNTLVPDIKGQIICLVGPPGVGKTTLLRSVAKKLSSGNNPMRTVVIDTRGELSFSNDGRDLCLDVLSGYPRHDGVDIATRCFNAEVIICDEIGDYEEAMALVASHNCGVPLIASAHASSVEELLMRTGIRLLHEAGIFGAYVGISRAAGMNFSYKVTRREECNAIPCI